MNLKKLGLVADIITGFPFESDLYDNKGVKVVRGENISEGYVRWDNKKCWSIPFERTDYYSLKPDDIVIGMDGSKVGKNKARIFESDLPILLAQRVACVRAKKMLIKFFYITVLIILDLKNI